MLKILMCGSGTIDGLSRRDVAGLVEAKSRSVRGRNARDCIKGAESMAVGRIEGKSELRMLFYFRSAWESCSFSTI